MSTATDIAIQGIFTPIITAGSGVAGLDYTASIFTWENLKRLYARLYPLMMLDFPHIRDYKTFVKLTKSHHHASAGSPPLPPLSVFIPLTPMIMAATVGIEPWSGLPHKQTGPYGIMWETQYASFRNVARVALESDRKGLT